MNDVKHQSLSSQEQSDTYKRQIYRVEGWRVIVCRDEIQWIIQKQTRKTAPDGGRWEGQQFFMTREALIREWERLTETPGYVFAALLPERFPRPG